MEFKELNALIRLKQPGVILAIDSTKQTESKRWISWRLKKSKDQSPEALIKSRI